MRPPQTPLLLIRFCFGGEKAIERGIFHLPTLDPIKPPKYVSVRSQQVITLVLIIITFFINFIAVRIAVFTKYGSSCLNALTFLVHFQPRMSAIQRRRIPTLGAVTSATVRASSSRR